MIEQLAICNPPNQKMLVGWEKFALTYSRQKTESNTVYLHPHS